jgi:NADPH:quinone reductase-like Zn-dependent oxidoreductase
LSGSICIFLPDVDKPTLKVPIPAVFNAVQHTVRTSKGFIWVTSGQKLADGPNEDMSWGFMRCIRYENPGLVLLTLKPEGKLDVDRNAEHIYQVTIRSLSAEQSVYEREYMEQHGVLHVGRLIEADDTYLKPNPRSSANATDFWRIVDDRNRPVALEVDRPGILDSLQFVDRSHIQDAPGADEIEIQVKACGLSFRDVLAALDELSESHLGSECSGIATQVREHAADHFKVGDRVVVELPWTLASVINRSTSSAMKIPSDMAFEHAAVLPIAFMAASYALHHWARIRHGETVLIHSASGGFGQASIQIAHLAGAKVFVTVGSQQKRDMLHQKYEIPFDHMFSSRTTSFAKGIRRITNGKGVDVVLNSLAGELLRASWDCVASFGRFIEVCKRDIYTWGGSSLGGLPMRPFSRNIMFASVDLELFHTRPGLRDELLQSVMQLAIEGKISLAKSVTAYPASQVGQVLRMMQAGNHIGAIVIQFLDDDVLSVVSPREEIRFDGNATYVLAGDLGGIDRSVSRRMARRGARHLILLSRSEVLNEAKQAFGDELTNMGIVVNTPQCDVADYDSLRDVLQVSQQGMPPIKGCNQASMVLLVSQSRLDCKIAY